MRCNINRWYVRGRSKGDFCKLAVVGILWALITGIGRAADATPSAAIDSQSATPKETRLHGQMTINQVPSSLTPGAREASDRYEALQHGHPLPGTDPMQLIMHGYAPPGMLPQQAIMLHNSLPNNLKMRHVPKPGAPEWVSRMAGEPSDPMTGLPIGVQRNGVAAQNQKILEEVIRERFGPIYIPPLHRDHNRPVQSATTSKAAERASEQKDMPVRAVPVKHSYTKDHLGSIREVTDSSATLYPSIAMTLMANKLKLLAPDLMPTSVLRDTTCINAAA